MVWFLPQFIPSLLQVAPFVLAFSILCAEPLRKYPEAFYIPWAVIVVLTSWSDIATIVTGGSVPAFVESYTNGLVWLRNTYPPIDTIINLFTSAVTGVFFYLIVMFIGAMRKGPTVRKLYTIRSELSILGGIVVMGHTIRVLPSLPVFASPFILGVFGTWGGVFMIIATGLVGIPLTVCFIVPWITSFPSVRKDMEPKTWKKVQKMAYPFMGLMVAQGFFIALAHALVGFPFDQGTAMYDLISNPNEWLMKFAQYVATAWMYLTIGLAYLGLKLLRRSERKQKQQAKALAAEKDAEKALA